MTEPSRRASARLTALIVASAMFMEQLDSTVLATALPTMAHSFGVPPLRMNVALTSYLLSLAVFIPASGTVADRLGTRTVFRAAIVIFTLGSILCGLAPSLPFLVVSRILQGIGGAMMVPVGRLALMRTASKAEIVTAMAWLTVPAMLGPVAGPPLGGFIVTFLSWHWIFYINVPIGILGIILVTRYIDDVREPYPPPFDFIGLILSGVALSFLMFAFELLSRGAVSSVLAGFMLGAGTLAAILYIFHARRHAAPVLDFRLLRIASFRVVIISGAIFRIAIGAIPFLLPMMMQLGFGLSAVESGLITFASSAGSMLMKIAARPILRWFGFRNALVWNGLLAAILLMFHAGLRPGWPMLGIYGLLLTGGFFSSLQFTAYNSLAYAEMSQRTMSAATSFYSTFQQLMLTMGISVAAAALEASITLMGHDRPMLSDFSVAFLVIAGFAFAAVPVNAMLDRGAGTELSGHKPKAARLDVPAGADD